MHEFCKHVEMRDLNVKYLQFSWKLNHQKFKWFQGNCYLQVNKVNKLLVVKSIHSLLTKHINFYFTCTCIDKKKIDCLGCIEIYMHVCFKRKTKIKVWKVIHSDNDQGFSTVSCRAPVFHSGAVRLSSVLYRIYTSPFSILTSWTSCWNM